MKKQTKNARKQASPKKPRSQTTSRASKSSIPRKRFDEHRRLIVTQSDVVGRKLLIYEAFCDPPPPREIVADDSRHPELQNWVVDHLKPEFAYASGISIMDAADAIAVSQVENGGEVIEGHTVNVAKITKSSVLRPIVGHAYLTTSLDVYVTTRRVDTPPNHGMREGAWILMVRKDDADKEVENDFYWLHEDGEIPDELGGVDLAIDLGHNDEAILLNAGDYHAYCERIAKKHGLSK